MPGPKKQTRLLHVKIFVHNDVLRNHLIEKRLLIKNLSRKKNSFQKKIVGNKQQQQPAFDIKKFRPAGVTSTPAPATTSNSTSGGSYEIKPRYASLADYLDQKGNNKNEETTNSKSAAKTSAGATPNRTHFKKRQSSSNDSGGVRKARPQKSSRKNKSR